MAAVNRVANESIILIISNPVEAMTYVAWKLSGFPVERVIGSGTTVDSARFRMIISKKTNEPVESITGMVIGGHGKHILPVYSSVTICGGRSNTVLNQLLEDRDEKQKIEEIMRSSSRDIIQLKGYENWAAGLAVGEIVESICSVRIYLVRIS